VPFQRYDVKYYLPIWLFLSQQVRQPALSRHSQLG
jgi:hypothetical protein